MQLERLGISVSSHSGVWGDVPAKIEFGAFGFSFKTLYVMVTVLVIFLRINLLKFVQFKQY